MKFDNIKRNLKKFNLNKNNFQQNIKILIIDTIIKSINQKIIQLKFF